MKLLGLLALVGLLGFATVPVSASVSSVPSFQNDMVEHGGGCRKSSPPGQCCHMDNKAGVVHCH